MLQRCLILLLTTVLAAPALAGGYGYGSRYHYGHYGHYGFDARYGHHGGGDAGAALVAGLLLGGMVGYLISEDRYYDRPAYRTYPRYRSRYYEPYRVYRVYEPPRRYERVYVPAEPRQQVTTTDPEFPGHACRMTREYTTTVELDGETRDAYGTKCLTASGAWVLGQPKLVPEFD